MTEFDPVAAVSFIHELGQLQQEKRNGWKRLGVAPESVAEHSLRAAQLAFVLAWMERHSDPAEVCAHAVFHDVAETRTSDLDKVHREYADAHEERAVRQQTAELGEMGEAICRMWRQVEECSTPAGRIAKDADYLEMAFKAKELLSQGCADAQLWIDGVRDALQTESAKKLLAALEEADPNQWWKRVCKLL
jgi:putative hydrolase of HD superfamily